MTKQKKYVGVSSAIPRGFLCILVHVLGPRLRECTVKVTDQQTLRLYLAAF